MPDPLRIACLAGAALLVSATPALAHAAFGTFSDFWTGVLHPVSGFRHGLPLLALALFAANAGVGRGHAALLTATPLTALATLIGAWTQTATPSTVDFAVALILSLLCAAALPLPRWAMAAIGAVAGVVMGLAHGGGLEGDPAWFAAGTGVGTGVFVFYLIELRIRMTPGWVSIAVRALASWVAAACVMALAAGL